MTKYILELYNKDQYLDLRKKEKEIKNALRDILSKKVGLNKCLNLLIEAHSIKLEVSEVHDQW